MERSNFVLAVLASTEGHALAPVQIQKLFFILERRIPDEIAGPHFAFKAYDYGPFDPDVYREVEALAEKGLAEVQQPGAFAMRTYRLTLKGQREGERLFRDFEPKTAEYIERVSNFVRTTSFADLVSAVYKAFPDMKVNSVFREP
jgi:uncharacterized protein YwgA